MVPDLRMSLEDLLDRPTSAGPPGRGQFDSELFGEDLGRIGRPREPRGRQLETLDRHRRSGGSRRATHADYPWEQPAANDSSLMSWPSRRDRLQRIRRTLDSWKPT